MIGNKQSTEAAGLGAGNWVLERLENPNSEIRSPNQTRSPNDEMLVIRVSSLVIDSGFELRHSGLSTNFQLPLSSSQAVEERRMLR